MATYASSAEYRSSIGDAQVDAWASRSPGVLLSAQITAGLDAGAGELDSALKAAGYAAPADPSVITDADEKARTTALLRDLNIALAAASQTVGVDDLQPRITSRIEWARKWLEDLKSGDVELGGLPARGGSDFTYTDTATVPTAALQAQIGDTSPDS